MTPPSRPRFLLFLPLVALLCLPWALSACGTRGGGGPSGDDDDAGDDDDSTDPCAGVEPALGTEVGLAVVAVGLDAPVHVTHANDGTGRLFVVEQAGTVVAIGSDGSQSTWLDIRSDVTVGGVPSGDERGLLALAFHPGFRTNGRLFVHYSGSGGATTVSEFEVEGDPLTDSPAVSTERVLLTQAQPASNHNGGQIAFGPDGYLYIGLGDGGGAGDTFGNGQNPGSLLAKILRIDVDGGEPYDIPADNPFVDDSSFQAETWAWGLRNPWRFSFDRETGDMWIGDVGQNSWEEVDIGRAGANYGWSQTEGNHCFAGGCDLGAYEAPVWDYDRISGTSVTGGHVYRGCRMPDLHGVYFFSDYSFVGSPLWSLTLSGDSAGQGPVWLDDSTGWISSFGEDEQGEIYLCDHIGGRLLQIVPAGG